MYVLTDKNVYIGKDYYNRPMIVTDKCKAAKFKTELAAGNYAKSIPGILKSYSWCVCNIESDLSEDGVFIEYPAHLIQNFPKSGKATPMEDEGFDICAFFEEVIRVMSNIDKYICNMVNAEQRADMKILDIRHYIRDNDHRLNAVQMQRLGYYLQELERERYEYKAKRLIASMFADNIDALKDLGNIDRMCEILTSKYKPKMLDDTDIEYIINKKKDAENIA